MFTRIVFFLVVILFGIHSQDLIEDLDNEKTVLYPCEKDTNIYYSEFSKLDDGEYNFYLFIKLKKKNETFILAKFATPTVFSTSDASMEYSVSRLDTLYTYVLKNQEEITIRLKTVNGIVPNIESIVIDNAEHCKSNPEVIQQINLMELFGHNKDATPLKLINSNCGQPKVDYTMLISKGSTTKRGDWPWHVALNKHNLNTFTNICGGTLISKTAVLTAAHCVTEYDITLPSNLFTVHLGKYNLYGSNEVPQVKEVLDIKVHKNFNHITLEYDIAVLILQTQAEYNDYVQPACLGPQTTNLFKEISLENSIGTVVGWGLNYSSQPEHILQKATFPRIDDLTCIKSNPTYYVSALNEQSFCAGWSNDTSACKGDSGGGFHVFVPDDPDDSSTANGRWYIQGIVSQTATNIKTGTCDFKAYVIFTDVIKLLDWINHILGNA